MTPDLKAVLERWRECYRPGGPHTDELAVAAALEALARENERLRQYIKVIFRHVDIAYSARELRIIGMNKDADLLVQCAMDARAILDAQDEPGGEGRDAD